MDKGPSPACEDFKRREVLFFYETVFIGKQLNKMQSDSSQLVERHLRLLRQHDKNGTDLVQSIPLVASKDLHSTKDELQSLAQYGLLAGILSPTDTDRLASHSVMTADDRLFFNTTSPSSTFICGAQGSGKSHTLSCLLENCLQPSDAAVLPHPLTALVFHYDTFISDDGGSPCEAAYLSSLAGVRVRVLCSPTNIRTIRVSINSPTAIQIESSLLTLTIETDDIQPLQYRGSTSVNWQP